MKHMSQIPHLYPTFHCPKCILRSTRFCTWHPFPLVNFINIKQLYNIQSKKFPSNFNLSQTLRTDYHVIWSVETQITAGILVMQAEVLANHFIELRLYRVFTAS